MAPVAWPDSTFGQRGGGAGSVGLFMYLHGIVNMVTAKDLYDSRSGKMRCSYRIIRSSSYA